MDPNLNAQESSDNYHSFGSNPTGWQDPAIRPRGQGHYQGKNSLFYCILLLIFIGIGPYPTSNPRIRPHGGSFFTLLHNIFISSIISFRFFTTWWSISL